MKALGVHEDVVVVTSRVWQTTCTLVRSGQEAFCIDSPVYPDELELLPRMAEEMGFRVVGRIATHADWDHLLAGHAFPDAPLGVAEASAPRLAGAAEGLRGFDDGHYVDRPAELTFDEPQVLPVPGHVGLGVREIELHPAPGHTVDGLAVLVPWAGVVVCGDYLSPEETPSVRADADLYLGTLERLGELVRRAEHVVPGHGRVMSRDDALAVLEADREFVASGAAGEEPRRRT